MPNANSHNNQVHSVDRQMYMFYAVIQRKHN